ncbi:caspase family protein [Bradyrhizobium sp. Tv2a-2]|uniref:caspase family protein n=1 Tax=Bradyrhizobium sp. Tv2a-2 TaxID=113395 RepID=UPI0006877C63|nr:caspase family protein [Bradyrhizobium sp. Tv2a-2]
MDIDAAMKLRQLLIYGLCLVVSAMFATAAAAERRVALVVGISGYKNAPTLPNTINDSNAIAALFKSIGFDVVISRNDLGVVDFKRTVREFLITAENADMAVVYYAGHGIEIGGVNYLIPMDARLSHDYDVDDEAIALDRIVWALEPVRRLRLILLDACRDNPFAAKLRSASRSPTRGGLAKLEEISADTLVAFAAKAGSISYDGDGVNSPYATALLRHLTEPGVDVRIALGRVRDEVLAMTGGRQEPFIYGSLGGATISLVPPLDATKVAPVPPPVAAAPIPRPVVPVPALPKPVAVNPTLTITPPAAKVELPKPPLPAQAAPAIADPCVRDEARLAHLRANPAPDEIINFQREVACQRLRPQVQRLFESFASDATPSPGSAAALVPVPALPKSVVVNSTPPTTPPAAKVELPRPPLPAQAAAEITDPCVRDEARLARLRAYPAPDEIVNFLHEVACQRLREQVQRLFESYASGTTSSPGSDAAPQPALNQPAQNEPVRAEDTCVRDTARLVRIRAEPTLKAITEFEKELGCEQLRSQLLRLRQSVAP